MSWDHGATSGGEQWNDGAANTPADDFARGSGDNGDDNGFNGGDAEGGGGGGFSGECFNCGQTGHSKQNCEEPPKPRPCYNCGEEGHSKADCTNERVEREFSGTCRLCEQQGHRAADCPTAPPKLCGNCQQEGHTTLNCENPRKIDYSLVEEIPAEVAWEQIRAAAEDRDIDDIKEAAQKYFKACPEATYVDMEGAFRTQDFKVYLIAIEKELAMTYTNMDLQGNLDKKYTVTWRLSDKPSRPKENDFWPASPEENLERLADAGVPVDRGVPKCSNCSELGHTSKHCSQDKMENADKAIVSCYNCSEVGHRVRDCPQPRPDRFACKNCNESGHGAKECPHPRNPANVECKVCNEKGHFAKDCPQAPPPAPCHNCGQTGHRKTDCTNERVMICRNCDEPGHTGRECPKPRDYSRVKCSNCGEMGHTKVRCKAPVVEDAEGSGANGYGGDDGGHAAETNGDGGHSGGAETGNDFGATPAVSGGWEGGGGGGNDW